MPYGNRWSKQTKHLISIGGGLSSTIELPLAVFAKYPADSIDMVMAVLKNESADVWRKVEWIEREVGKEVIRIAWTPKSRSIHHGLRNNYWVNPPGWAYPDIWDAFEFAGRMGSTLADPCSRMLKRETIKRFVLDHYDAASTIMHVGITADEIDRMMAIQGNWGKIGIRVEADLTDAPKAQSSIERSRSLLGWTPESYALGWKHDNCGGFCVKAGHADMARLLWYKPNVYAYHEVREAEFRARHGTNATIMRDRKTVGGVSESTPLSLKQFRQRMQTRWAGRLPGFDPFEDLEDTPACRYCSEVA